MKGIREFTTGFERAFNDRFGLRDDFVRLNNLFLLTVFSKSPSKDVAVGRDNWLFYTAGGSYDWFIGKKPPPQYATITAIAKGIERRVRLMRDLGIPYRIVIAPDKHSIYWEQLPFKQAKALKPYSLIDDITKLLADDVRGSVLDLRPQLIAAKKQRPVYYATDSHWNSYGAWIGYREIMAATGLKAEPYPQTVIERAFAGDLSRMIGAETIFNEMDSLPKPYIDEASPCQKPDHYSAAFKSYRCPQAENGDLVMHVDSFGAFIEPFLNPRFRTASYIVNGQVWDIARLKSNPPALVVDEIVERALPNLANSPAALMADHDGEVAADRLGTFTCAVESVQVQRAEGFPSRIIRVGGWAADLNRGSLVDRLWISLNSPTGRFKAEADTHHQRPDIQRPDVGNFFKKNWLAGSAFGLTAAAGAIPEGEYSVELLAEVGNSLSKCTTNTKVTIAP